MASGQHRNRRHFADPHMLVKKQYNGTATAMCDICGSKLASLTGYGCSDCNFHIHEACAGYFKEIISFFAHPWHALTLTRTPSTSCVGCSCDLCSEECPPGTFVYRCARCMFYESTCTRSAPCCRRLSGALSSTQSTTSAWSRRPRGSAALPATKVWESGNTAAASASSSYTSRVPPAPASKSKAERLLPPAVVLLLLAVPSRVMVLRSTSADRRSEEEWSPSLFSRQASATPSTQQLASCRRPCSMC